MNGLPTRVEGFSPIHAGNKVQSNVLYVSNFSRNVRREELKELFSPFGALSSLDVFNFPSIPVPYAFVEYDDLRDAVEAKKKLDQSFYQCSTLVVQYRRQRAKQ